MAIAFLRKILYPQNDTIKATIMLVDLLKVHLTKTTLVNELEEHPDFPKFLSIGDTLNNYGIDNVIASFDVDKLSNIPTPFIALIKSNKESPCFSVIREIKNENFTLFDFDRNVWITVSKRSFKEMFLDEAMYIEVNKNNGEKDYHKKVKEEKRIKIIQWSRLFYIPFVVIITSLIALFRSGINALLPFIFYLLALVGAVIGILLLSFQYNRHDPALQQICNSGIKVNCGNVLNSDAAKIAGISWSEIGFCYFAGQLLLLLFYGVTNPQNLLIVGWLSIVALGYTFFSVYYQWRVAKQWCVLCLSVQAILLLQFIISLLGAWPRLILIDGITPEFTVGFISAFATPFIGVSLLMPAFEKAKESKQNKRDFHFLKRNPDIFEALLSGQETVTESSEGLGILLGSNDAKFKILKVSNPYCNPCAKTHVVIDELLENNINEIQLREIYLSSNDENDKSSSPVKHLLAIADKGDEEQTRCALDDWYFTEQKNYESFAAKYPINGELKLQDEKIDKMRDWCIKMNVYSTPTFFINGYKLPKLYNINDLKYFLTED